MMNSTNILTVCSLLLLIWSKGVFGQTELGISVVEVQTERLQIPRFFCKFTDKIRSRPALRRIRKRLNCPIPVNPPADCAPFIDEVAALGDVVDRASNTLVFAKDMLMNISCTALVANVTIDEFSVDVCEEAKRQTIVALGDGGQCANALANYTGNSTPALLSLALKTSGSGNRHLQTCGGSEAGCSDLVTCQFLSAVCRPAGGTVVSAVAAAGVGLVANYFRASLGAILVAYAISIGPTAIAAIILVLTLLFDAAVAELQGLYCDDAQKKCVDDGTAAGLDCQGAACCPDETGTRCGQDCCCCGLYLAPRGPSCQCVPAE